MAKLIDIEESDNKKKKILQWTIIVVCIFALLCTAIIYSSIQKNGLDEETENTYIGIHVKGAVVNSGYYEVPFGTRVKDLEEVVGGFAPDADTDGVNLAGFVKDGEEIYIPYKGTAENGAVNLNMVTFEELVEIDGIGESTARKILDYRAKRGTIESVTELRSELGVKKYEEVRERFYVVK